MSAGAAAFGGQATAGTLGAGALAPGQAADAAGAGRLAAPLDRELGGRTASMLDAQLGLRTVGDLLRHYPRRYARRGELTSLADLPLGEHVTVVAEVVSVGSRPMRQRRGQLLEAVVTDGHGRLRLTFFSGNRGMAEHWSRLLQPGTRALFSGKVDVYRGVKQLTHPDFDVFDRDLPDDEARALADTPRPIYPATAKVPSWKVERAVGTVLDTLDASDVPDPLPAEVRERLGFVGLAEALTLLHRPAGTGDVERARERLRFEEAFVLQVALARRRLAAARLPAVPRRARPGGLLAAFDARLPFALTRGQREVGEQIEADLAAEHPMQRLLQGEVGSGKTVVALRAMLTVVDAGGQAALLAPTEVLAAQHHRSITAMLGDLAAGGMLGGSEVGTRVELLTGSLPAAARRRALLEAASGGAGIVVGTHALLSEHVDFADLGLVVVDEQHRFGVDQRDLLRAKAATPPHVLVMTATPIPRTVAMTAFGDLETSVLAELPGGRRPITTHVVPGDRPAWVERTWHRVREEVDAGRQAFVVCPRIGGVTDGQDGGSVGRDGDAAGQDGAADGAPPGEVPAEGGAAAPAPPVGAVEVLAALREHPALEGVPLGLLHGRLPAEEKEATMLAFARGDLRVLVATTVVEVGVDVPAATVMVVLDADRFGVSQLHQLRGRVGRGEHPGLCLLVTGVDPGGPAGERLAAVAATLDGFELARVDLEARREGDVLGAAQSGARTSLRLLRVVRDEDVIVAARAEAGPLVERDPELAGLPGLRAALAEVLDPEREAYLERG